MPLLLKHPRVGRSVPENVVQPNFVLHIGCREAALLPKRRLRESRLEVVLLFDSLLEGLGREIHHLPGEDLGGVAQIVKGRLQLAGMGQQHAR